jgi:outer membrane receptor protein involved in Fe transport
LADVDRDPVDAPREETMRRSLKIALLASAFGSVSAFSDVAVAADADNGNQVTELVVTAQKREEKIFEVPLAVQAISKVQLQQSGAAKVSDLVSAIPGASIVSDTTPGFETVQIRGIGSGTTGDGLVGYYIDDTPFGIPNLQLTPPASLLDLDRVEVIRGPSGTLYGQGSSGGTIKLVTTKPNTEQFSGTVQGEVAGTDSAGVDGGADGSINILLIKGRLALRATGGYEYLAGYADVPEQHLRNANNFHGANGRVSILWTPRDDFDVSAFYWRIVNRQDFSNALTPHNATTESLIFTPFGDKSIAGTNGIAAFTDVTADVYSLTFHWRTPVGEVTSNSSFIQHDLNFVDPLLTILVNQSNFKTNSFTQEVRITSLPDAPFNYIAGVSYRDATIHSQIDYYENLEPLGYPAGTIVPIIDITGPLTTKSISLFGEVSKSLFGGKLEPLAGLRYFHDDRSSSGLDHTTGLITNQSATYESFNPRFNLKYHATDTGLFYINIAKGFRSGALQTPSQAAAANTTLGLPAGTIGTTIQPDSLWTYEAGTRWQFAHRALTFEASYYHTDWSDVVVQFATSAVISLANAGNAEIDGVDLGLVWATPVDGLTLSASGNVNDSRFTSVVGALATATAVRVGGQLPNVPRSNATVSADYKHDLPWWNGVQGNLYVSYAYRDKQDDATTKGLSSGSIDDLTVRAGVRKGPWRANVFVTNALNDSTPSVATSTAYEIIYPRRVGLQLGYDF